MADNDKKRGLGRGLSALMADVAEPEAAKTQSDGSSVRMVPIEKVFANPEQPRKTFTQPELEDLSASIKEKGVLQPLIVRSKLSGSSSSFEIVAGERRWRAAQMAQLHQIPVIVREFSDTEVLEVAIIENVQRADLNAIEEALGYRLLMDRFGHTQEKVSEALGKSRSHIANLLRLLNLPAEIQTYVQEGVLSAGHARALIGAPNPLEIAKQVIANSLSVRETERLVKNKSNTPSDQKAPKSPTEKDADTRALEADLSAALGMKVALEHEGGGEAGKLSVSYKNLEELDDLCRKLSGS